VRRVWGAGLAGLAGLAYALFAADTTQAFQTHSLGAQPSITLLLLAYRPAVPGLRLTDRARGDSDDVYSQVAHQPVGTNHRIMDTPLVSIITPSFNQEAFLPATIESVLAQDYPRIEYGIVDGGSTDGSLPIIQDYADRLAWWVSEPDAGQTAAINKGFARAQGDILAWLNSDDVLAPNAVREAVEYLTSHPDVGMVYGRADYIDATGKRVGAFPSAPTDYRRLRRGYVHIPQQAAFFRARLWRMVGPLDESFDFAMDYDLWVRLAALTPIAYHPRRWAGFRLHPASKTTAADDLCWPEMIRVHRRLGGGPLAQIYLRYALRRMIGPLWPHRMRWQIRRAGSHPH